ncbi:hypothetical protein GCM10023335_50350 [Streptomyces siamensis]|uniref:Uncharacterized protein n=1 Tax=Streptomyces siamensis TaxID=1274986 RepID=A0ABP9J6L9_9ACTN
MTAALATMPVPITAANQLGPNAGRVVLFTVGGERRADEEEFMIRTLWSGRGRPVDHVLM